MRRFIVALCGLVAWSAVGRAQTIRGVVTESSSGTPLSGVLMTLFRGDSLSSAPALVTVLTNDRGAFVLRAPAVGTYRVGAKRIGVRRFISAAIELAAEQDRTLDITLEPVVFTLPEVRVETNAVCASRGNEAPRLASLWEEARTALTATQISLRDRLFRARIVRYRRELDPRSLRIESEETRQQAEGVVDKPFVSLSGDSLSKAGYWRVERNNEVSYSAPDADVLLSTAFLRDHCFALAEGRGEQQGLMGMRFEPREGREKNDIRGTIWLDAKSFELRLVEFRYTQLAPAPNMQRVGGEVHFARLPSGAWVVHKWFIRMPRYSERSATRSTGVPGERPIVVPIVVALTEEGGNVTAEGLRSAEKPASLTGTVTDSAGGGLAGATLRLRGTQYLTRSDSSGRFRFDSLPPGSYTLIADHFAYEELGMGLGQQEVSLGDGAALNVAVRAPGTEAIIARLCDGKKPVRGLATLRVTIRDSATSVPVRNLRLRLSWKEYGSSTGGNVSITPRAIEGTTDATGSVAFCELPADQPLSLVVLREDRMTPQVAELKLLRDDIDARVFRVAARR
jgi:hypothetical protein